MIERFSEQHNRPNSDSVDFVESFITRKKLSHTDFTPYTIFHSFLTWCSNFFTLAYLNYGKHKVDMVQ